MLKKVDDKTLSVIRSVVTSGRFMLPESMLEKDVLVADVVERICELGKEDGVKLVFCGGTSLSQAYQMIDRMSEDADFRIILPEDVKSHNQQRGILSQIKKDLVRALEEMGHPLEGELKAGNANAYIMGNFLYDSRFPIHYSLRPHIKIEITAFEPISNIHDLPLRTILDRIAGSPYNKVGRNVSVVSVEDTLADKVVSYLRRSAADRSENVKGKRDDRLVRHLYDVHKIVSVSPETRDQALSLFVHTMERDRETFGNQFPDFKEDPAKVLREELEFVTSAETRSQFESFAQTMIYGEIPEFSAIAKDFYDLASECLDLVQNQSDAPVLSFEPK